jgi:Pentapeptide repeats (8 copies)
MPDLEAPEQREEQGHEKWYERMRYQVLLFTGGIALFVLFGGWILDWYIAPHTSAQTKDLVQALGLITAGVAGAVGIFFTWRGQRLKNLRVTREGQITGRFAQAIDQLGKVEDGQKLFEIRIGGIYALERIARESEEYYWPIMEILTAYVRQNAPWPPKAGQERAEHAKDKQRDMERAGGKSETTEPSPPDPDIQAIMTVLRRRRGYYRHGEPEILDLRDTNLREANLREADLTGANFFGANLREANLSGADLYAVDLFEANLTGANLTGAILSGVSLTGANLTGANLTGAILDPAILTEANLKGANLKGAKLTAVIGLTQEQLEQAEGDETTQIPPPLKPPAHWA